MNQHHIDLMLHCIGMDTGNGKPYKRHGKLFFKPNRNYFDCGRADEPSWREIEAAGLAHDTKVGNRPLFELTEAGIAFLSEHTGVHIHWDSM